MCQPPPPQSSKVWWKCWLCVLASSRTGCVILGRLETSLCFSCLVVTEGAAAAATPWAVWVREWNACGLLTSPGGFEGGLGAVQDLCYFRILLSHYTSREETEAETIRMCPRPRQCCFPDSHGPSPHPPVTAGWPGSSRVFFTLGFQVQHVHPTQPPIFKMD